MGDARHTMPDDSQRPLAHLVDDVAEILDLPEAERPAAFARLRDAHPDVADRLRAWEAAARGLDTGEGSEIVPEADATIPSRIGRYRITRLLGEGGMGRVYHAEQSEPVRREVALKVVKRGMDSRAVLSRFERERQALALMSHDHIARVFDAGETPDGQPYFAMEYVDGRPVTVFCDAERLDMTARLRLFMQICRGVEHAHQKGVIHRDLKPTNVLVAGTAAEPAPKIIDFGLARAIDASLEEGTLRTIEGQIVGTPEYMSPEQADGSIDLDTRTDVYALGVLLYELLTGSLPFARQDSGGNLAELRRRIRDEAPRRPSAALTQLGGGADAVAAQRQSSTSSLGRALRGDLDWVVMRAIEKERDRRYASPGELAADLERYLRHEAVVAGPPSWLYRARKFTRRYRAQVGTAAITLLALIAGLLGTAWGLWRAERSHAQAVANLDRFDLLSQIVVLQDARDLERELYPPLPTVAPRMRDWLTEADRLSAMLPRVRSERATITALAAELGNAPNTAVDGRMSLGQARYLEQALIQLEADLTAFAAPDGEIARVRERLDWAHRVEELSIDRHRDRWSLAQQAIRTADGVSASSLYGEGAIDLTPQLGLVPIGPNPKTKLWEFYELRSAADPTVIPAHAADGSIPHTEGTGIVLVLLPGGIFQMGAQQQDRRRPNYDEWADQRDAPVHDVALSPFFVGRYEITQAQWKRMTGGDQPSLWRAGTRPSNLQEITWWNPVHDLSWARAQEALRQHGLVLPTEAQWEYACRAGTNTTWWTGRTLSSLEGAANLADATAAMITRWAANDEIDDRHVYPAPVGSFRPNAFGLHDMIGNVLEPCSDTYQPYGGALREGDGLRLPHEGEDPRVPAAPHDRVVRGGSYNAVPVYGRSAWRNRIAPERRGNTIGVRAARPIAP